MSKKIIHAIIIQESPLTFQELCQALHADEHFILELIEAELITPQGTTRQVWRFDAIAFKRAQKASRLNRDLGINVNGIELALQLLDRIDHLETELAVLKKIWPHK